ncbi:iron ABC transporter permease [Seleniivibrio sp.]|uniref:FecCD family ABC transporter permease n=1 Tax=Seleniivibrio sp. TaxID=2898801 RepID=UPI0025EE928B|nr:iron ABC transporter permease [Seleniivibrio sp.]MCD8554734.1 iron ABC transporter permease [Seleniivibrio sp.]
MTAVLKYRKYELKRILIVLLLAFLTVVMVVVSVFMGSSGTGFKEVLTGLTDKGSSDYMILWELRIPRIVMAVLVGWGLALSGVASQISLRNPLASPFTLGVSSGAAFGAVLAIMYGASVPWIIAACAFAGAMLTTLAVLAIGRVKGASPEAFILSGVALMFLFSALTSLMQYTATLQQVQAVVFWMFGSLANSTWNQIGITAAFAVLPSVWFMRRAWDFNMMIESDETARACGINTGRLRFTAMMLAALMCASSICFTGVIGFIGLVSPHISRLLLGSDHRFLFPASGLVGAILVITADTAGRTLWNPQVIPLGIMTSFIGVPFFLWLILKKRMGGHI